MDFCALERDDGSFLPVPSSRQLQMAHPRSVIDAFVPSAVAIGAGRSSTTHVAATVRAGAHCSDRVRRVSLQAPQGRAWPAGSRAF
jgi:hypothetical protein